MNFARPLARVAGFLCSLGLTAASAHAGGMNTARVALPSLVGVPGGRFIMGGREADPPQELREVEVASFLMGRTEVTVAEYTAWLNAVPPTDPPASPHIVGRNGRYAPKRGCARLPVAWVSCEDAAAYCRWLGERTGRTVRLPTEAEWEYAARGGIRGARYPWGWGPLQGRACFAAPAPRPVGSFPPNGFGLHDMAGNVYEWCQPEPGTNGPVAVARGGSWAEQDVRFLRVYWRVFFPCDYRNADVGFRVVVEPE